LIATDSVLWDPLDFLHAAGLVSWRFDHLLAEQLPFARFCAGRWPSPYADVAGGYAEYCRHLCGDRPKPFTRLEQQAAKLARDVGKLHFVSHVGDSRWLDLVIDWKTAQYQRTGVANALALPHTRAILDQIRTTQTPEFAGLMSVLFAGDRPVAAHFGMRSRSVWHYWFPVYDAGLAAYSPGLLLVLMMIKECAGLGIRRLDFGAGEGEHKRRFMTGARDLAYGEVDARAWRRWRRGGIRLCKRMIDKAPGGAWLRQQLAARRAKSVERPAP
jgi:hypothetical protein